jgi:hypothetical protein
MKITNEEFIRQAYNNIAGHIDTANAFEAQWNRRQTWPGVLVKAVLWEACQVHNQGVIQTVEKGKLLVTACWTSSEIELKIYSKIA